MEVDEARRDDEPGRVELGRVERRTSPTAAMRSPSIATSARTGSAPGAVDDRAAPGSRGRSSSIPAVGRAELAPLGEALDRERLDVGEPDRAPEHPAATRSPIAGASLKQCPLPHREHEPLHVGCPAEERMPVGRDVVQPDDPADPAHALEPGHAADDAIADVGLERVVDLRVVEEGSTCS